VELRVVPARPLDDEAALIAACVRGEANAQRVLFRREYDRVFRTIGRIIGAHRDVDDLLQETFVIVFRSLPTFRQEAKLATWIDRIAVRVVFHHLRGKKRQFVPFEAIGDVEDGSNRVDERAHAREGLRRLYAVLAELSPDARTAYALYAIDGRSIAEVAELTGTATVTAKVRIWRARREVMRAATADPVLSEVVRVKS
jgi:RNA polymerase sigma-70 factor (ECF subfamily)